MPQLSSKDPPLAFEFTDAPASFKFIDEPDQSMMITSLATRLLLVTAARMGGGLRSRDMCMACEEFPHAYAGHPCQCPCHPLRQLLGL